MKKLLSILLVTMFTMAFVQAASMPVSYFTVKNKTTGLSGVYKLKEFTSIGGRHFARIMESSCLGIYEGDQIEITYTPAIVALTPHLSWTYSWDELSSFEFGTGKTVELTVPKPSFDGKTLTVTCEYWEDGLAGSTPVSDFYNFLFANVRTGKRFDVGVDSWNNLFRVTYNHYDEVKSCLTTYNRQNETSAIPKRNVHPKRSI